LLGIPDDSMFGLLLPDALKEVRRVLPRVTKPFLNPVRDGGELVDRQGGDERGAVTEQRRALTVGVIRAVAETTAASQLTRLGISEKSVGATTHGLGTAAMHAKFRDDALHVTTGRPVAASSTSLGLMDSGLSLANRRFGTLTGRLKARDGALFSLVRMRCGGSTTDLLSAIAPILRGPWEAVHGGTHRRTGAA
jgi:hypothetical protein